MTTLEQIRDRFLASVDDGGGAIWPNSLVDQWVEEGIHDFALHLPPSFVSTLTATSEGQQVYTLDGRARGVLSVEYPVDESPPCYLVHRPVTLPHFFYYDDSYDVLDGQDTGAAAQLIVSARPGNGATLRVRWTGAYEIPADKEQPCPIPDQYTHILLLYCTWRAQQHQLMAHTANPSTTAADLLRHFSTNAERSERAYRTAVRLAQQRQQASGVAGVWRMDRWG